MLGKLFKHDFHALSRTLLPLHLGVLGAGLMACVMMTVALRVGSNADFSVLGMMMSVMSGAGSVLLIVAVVASALITLLLVVGRVYKNLMSDEGYLTFTLPATAGQQLWSKLLTGLVWVVINALVIVLVMVLYALFGTNSTGVLNVDIWEGLSQLVPSLGGLTQEYQGTPLLILQLVVLAITAGAQTLLQLYLAVILGCTLAKKHKVMAAIGFWFAINIVRSIVMTLLGAGLLIFGTELANVHMTDALALGLVQGSLFGNILLALLWSAAFFLSTRALLKNNLNLQ